MSALKKISDFKYSFSSWSEHMSGKSKWSSDTSTVRGSIMKDWQSGSLASTNLFMLENGICSDVILRVGQAGEPIPAHKFMLVSRSRGFNTLFGDHLSETGREVIIPDIEANVMMAFLRFLYTEKEEIVPDTVMGLLYASKKYEVHKLTTECEDYLEREINNDNVCSILEQAHRFDDKSLRKKCLSVIFSNSDKVLKSPVKDYQNLCYDCLKKLLESDKLKTKEETIFLACLDWAEGQCRKKNIEINDENLRAVMRDLLFLIRYTNMGRRAFAELVSGRDLLTADEKVAVFQSSMKSPRDGDRMSARSARYQSKSRNKTEIYRINRFKEVVGGTFDFWVNDNLNDAISFMASRDINLFGVGVFRPFPNGLVRGGVQLYDESNWCMARKENLEIIYDPKDTMQDARFKGSIRIKEGKWYTIMQQMAGSKSFFGTKGQKQVHGEGVVITFRNSPMYKNNTDIDSGQIPALLYS